MMTQTADGTGPATAHLEGTCEAGRAERHAAGLRDLIDRGELTPDGRAAAHGALALTWAVLALRETIAAAAADTADAVTDLDATLGIIAGAVTDAVTGADGQVTQ